MQKVSAGRGHQRLLQLARSQLGQEFAAKPAPLILEQKAQSKVVILISAISAWHNVRVRLLLSMSDFKGRTLSQRAERRERMHKRGSKPI